MAYSFAQLEGLWIQAGGSKKLAPVMAAIALAESQGDPGAVNPNDNNGTQTSWGLWQISDGTHSQPEPNILNPLVNAKAAVAKYHSEGLHAWGTYGPCPGAAYCGFLGSAAPVHLTAAQINAGAKSAGSGGGGTGGWLSFVEQAAGGALGQLVFGQGLATSAGPGTPAASGLSGLGGIAEGLAGLTIPFIHIAQAIDWFFVPSHIIRIVAGVGGGVLVVLGLNSFRHIGGPSSVSVAGTSVPQASGSMALALGIGEVGIGAVLLFVAFHNLDPKITTVGGVLADLQQKAQTDLSAKTSPAAAVTAAGGG